jgi:hypothetical protein
MPYVGLRESRDPKEFKELRGILEMSAQKDQWGWQESRDKRGHRDQWGHWDHKA